MIHEAFEGRNIDQAMKALDEIKLQTVILESALKRIISNL